MYGSIPVNKCGLMGSNADVESYYELIGVDYSLDTTLSASLQLIVNHQGGNLVCWR